jgi:hypothetical protein
MTTMTINKKDYSCKKMKEMEGHDGYVIRFDLCYKGKKVAEVYDDGNGGCIDIEWVKAYSNNGSKATHYQDGAKEDFDALIEQMGSYEFMGSTTKYCDEVLVIDIYEEARLEKDLKKKLKKKVLYINKEGSCQEIGWTKCKAITQNHIDAAYKHYPEIKITLNEMSFDKALETFISVVKK